MGSWCLQSPEESIGSPGTEIIDSSSTMWMMGIEPGSFGRAAIALCFLAIFLGHD